MHENAGRVITLAAVCGSLPCLVCSFSNFIATKLKFELRRSVRVCVNESSRGRAIIKETPLKNSQQN